MNSPILKLYDMYAICIEDDALFKGGGICSTPLVNPQSYDPSCDLCSLALWTYAISYDCGIMPLCMINLIKDLLLMFNNMTLYFGIIINVNSITRIFVIFECC